MNTSLLIDASNAGSARALKAGMPGSLQRAPHINAAVRLLRSGQVVAFPTETVYGLGGDARSSVALKRIFQLKGRPADHPLIVHIAGTTQLHEWARDIPAAAWKLAERFWPGPLTLILKKAAGVLPLVTGGQDTIGLRIPAHPLALELLRAFDGGLAAPSANPFGRVSPTCPAHVHEEFADKIPLVLDGGYCRVGVESTILSLVTDEPVLLRPGDISITELADVLGCQPGTRDSISGGIRAPGMLTSHYTIRTPLHLIKGPECPQRIEQVHHQERRVACMILDPSILKMSRHHCSHIITMPNAPQAYARELYRVMRDLDRDKYDLLLVETPPQTEEWSAINNRLQRAAAKDTTTGEML